MIRPEQVGDMLRKGFVSRICAIDPKVVLVSGTRPLVHVNVNDNSLGDRHLSPSPPPLQPRHQPLSLLRPSQLSSTAINSLCTSFRALYRASLALLQATARIPKTRPTPKLCNTEIMNATKHLLQHRQPMIRFLGKRSTPSKVDHTPQAHPASPTHSLPESFASYRQKAQQHGPLNQTARYSSGGAIGGHSGASLGPVEAGKGMFFDRSELPERFRRTPWTQAEIDAVESGGASMFA